MKNPLFLLLFIFAFRPAVLLSQQDDANGRIIAFHPNAGNTITQSEKSEFGIFREYNDSLFDVAQLIKYNDSTYRILIKTVDGKSILKNTDQQELNAIYAAIDKVRPAEDYKDDAVPLSQRDEEKERIRRQRNQEWADFFTESTVRTMIFLTELTLYIIANIN
jgi:hypothetical protein